jgi:cold shock CspA family protein
MRTLSGSVKKKKITGKVNKYIPSKMYGFVLLEGNNYFFHLSRFKGSPPEPLVGENVACEIDPSSEGNFCLEVVRLESPEQLSGVVVSFDLSRGFGKIEGEDHSFYFLHRCEMIEGRIPSKGSHVSFYKGSRGKNNRALYVKIKEQKNE